MIAQRFPTAQFAAPRGEDPEGVDLDVIVDIEDPDEVMDLVVERLLEFQVKERLPIHVIPLRPLARMVAELQQRSQRSPEAPGAVPQATHR